MNPTVTEEEETCCNRGNKPYKPTVTEEMKDKRPGTINASKAIKSLCYYCIFYRRI